MKTVRFGGHECEVRVTRGTFTRIELRDAHTHEPVAVATLNIPDRPAYIDQVTTVFIKDYSENSGMVDCLVQAGILNTPAEYCTKSGFVTICAYKLSNEFVLDHNLI